MSQAHYALPVLLLVAACMPAVAGPPEPSPAFREFTGHVNEYLKLQKALPRLRTTSKRQEIIDRRLALAQKIREARSNAKAGDVFCAEVSAEFRKIIRDTLQSGPKAPSVRKTIREGEPAPTWRPSVNGDYPENLPLTTVPPTLLSRLPQLPPEVAYRIMGHDFVLQDTEARIVIDFIPDALP